MGRDLGQWFGVWSLWFAAGITWGICLERQALAGSCPAPKVEVVTLTRVAIQRIEGPDDGGQTQAIWPEQATFNAPGEFAVADRELLSTSLEEYQ